MQNQPQSKPDPSLEQVLPIHEDERKMHARACVITALEELEEDVVEDCAIPQYQDSPSIKLPTCPRAILHIIVGRRGFCSVKPQELPKLHCTLIPTIDNAIRVPQGLPTTGKK